MNVPTDTLAVENRQALAQIRARTRAAHAALEAEPVFTRVADPQAPLSALGDFLAVLHAGLQPLEPALCVPPDRLYRPRLARLAADLQALGHPVPALQMRAWARPDADTRLGWLYVVEGSSLGATVLGRAWTGRCAAARRPLPAHFTDVPAGGHWAAVCAAVSACHDPEAVACAAEAVFAHWVDTARACGSGHGRSGEAHFKAL